MYWERVLEDEGKDEARLEAALRATAEHQQLTARARVQEVDLGDFRILADPADLAVGAALVRDRSYEPHLVAQLRRRLRPGAAMLDLGANIGFYTLLAAAAVGPTGRVVSFEPNGANLQLLYGSLLANRFENVEVFPFAASDHRGFQPLLTVGSNGVLNFVDSGNLTIVPLVRLDDVLPAGARFDVVKMDIEGHEPAALRGMERLLRRCRPVLFTEFFPWAIRQGGGDPERYLQALLDLGYGVEVLKHDGAVVPARGADDVMSTWASYRSEMIQVDLVATPR
jgi:FkbM family methyltransferase